MGGRDELCGRTVGEFVLRERIGEGGFGAVYRCEQPLLGREAVVKVLHHRLRDSEVVLQRFMREAQLASKLDHPYAAHVYAFGVEKDDGLFWIAMEMVQGTTLDRWLTERGPLPLAQLVPFFERVAEVVQTGHERGIVHRDLKPSNIMVIERAGRLLPKLLDFGIAKLVEDARPAARAATGPRAKRSSVVPDAATLQPDLAKKPSEVATLPPVDSFTPRVSLEDPLTHADATLGSPPYMSPEQWNDAPSVGPRSDLYALGVVAYEALTGRRPFTAATIAGYIDMHCNQEVPPVGGKLPPALDALFRRALAKRPEERPATALELAAELRVAAGLAAQPVDNLPKLDETLREAWLADAPQPLAEAIAVLDGARNVHQARDATRDLFRTLLRYLLALALAGRSQVRTERSEPALLELLRELPRRDLGEDERVRLLRLLLRPFATRRAAHPLPELVDLVLARDGADALDPVLALRPTSDSGGSEEVVRSQLAQLVAALGRLLRAAKFVLDYPLVVPRDHVDERWCGLRRRPRSALTLQGTQHEELQPLLVDRDGRAVLFAWPLIQVTAPTPGAELELFVFDGRGRHGARLTSVPAGFEHNDPDIWDWFGQHVVGEPTAGGEQTLDERPPYLGLASFSEADADRFVGREHECLAFLNRLRQNALQVVVGASGAGKSSFVHAGVLPALPPGWRTIKLRPGFTPLASLAARLAAAGVSGTDLRPLLEASPAAAAALVAHAAGDGAIVVVIDQLEELFTLCGDAAERERFAAVLAHLGASVDVRTRVICTVRDDFLMNVESLAPLRARLSPALYLLGNPSRDDLARTVVEPARRVGYELSDAELARDMVDVVADRPGALALLSFTASRLWELRDRRFRQLTRKAYDAMGGVGGALGQHAEETLAGLSPDEQRTAREVFRHLVTADGTRTVLAKRELRQRLAGARADAVLDKLVAARLIAVVEAEGEAQVELMHEALIAAWPRLQQWVREDAEGVRMREQLRTAARQWNERSRQPGLLWRDEALADLERWRRRSDVALTDLEAAFADASSGAAARGRRIRRGILAAAFIAVSATALVMFQLRQDAARKGAEVQERLVQSYIDQARTKLLDGRRWEALASLVAAQKLGATGPVIETMRALARAPAKAMQYRFTANHGRTWSVRYSPDGTRLVTAGEDGAAVWDARTGELRARLADYKGNVRDALFDPTGTRVATAGFDGTLRIWDAGSGKQLVMRKASGDVVRCVAWRGDGRWLATGGGDGAVHVWAPDGSEQFALTTDDKLDATTCEFGRTLLAVGTRSGKLLLVDPEARTSRIRGRHDAWARSVQWDPAGERIVSASSDRTVRVWDLDDAHPAVTLVGANDMLISATFSPDAKRVAAVGRDGIVRVWDAASGAPQLQLKGHEGVVWYVEFSRDGTRLVSGADDGSARLWDARSGTTLAVLEGHGAPVPRARFSPDGTQIVTASYEGTVVAWNPAPAFVAPEGAPEGAKRCDVNLSLDGAWATVACADQVSVWSVAAHRVTARIPGAKAAAANATRALTATDADATLYELPSGRVLGKLHADANVAYIAAAPDRFALGDRSGTVRIVELDGASRVGARTGEELTTVAVLARDRLLTVGSRIRLYDRDRESVAYPIDATDQMALGILSPNQRWFALVGLKDLWLTSPSGPATLVKLVGHQAATINAAFDRAATRLVSTSQDGGAILWDLRSRMPVRRLVSRSQFLAGAVFDDTDTLVVALDGTGALQLFDAATGAAIGTVDGGVRVPRALERASDGAFVGFGHDGGVTVWRIARDTDERGAARDLACKAPPSELVGACVP